MEGECLTEIWPLIGHHPQSASHWQRLRWDLQWLAGILMGSLNYPSFSWFYLIKSAVHIKDSLEILLKSLLTCWSGRDYRERKLRLCLFQPPGLMDSTHSITQRTSPSYHGGQAGAHRDKMRTSSGDSCRDRAGPGDRERIRNQLILGRSHFIFIWFMPSLSIEFSFIYIYIFRKCGCLVSVF